MHLTCFQSLQWLIVNSVIIMAGKGPFLVEAWAPWKIWGGHLPTPYLSGTVYPLFCFDVSKPESNIYRSGLTADIELKFH